MVKEKVSLTSRQKEVITLVAEGYNDKKIAKMLYVSPKTVRSHLKEIYYRLSVYYEEDYNTRIMAINKYFGRSSHNENTQS